MLTLKVTSLKVELVLKEEEVAEQQREVAALTLDPGQTTLDLLKSFNHLLNAMNQETLQCHLIASKAQTPLLMKLLLVALTKLPHSQVLVPNNE